ncbi:pyocin activator PrtN family protein [Aquirhabdus parva]|uniref:Pyocin activator protein PrtN n=1 Tax=Aquirhabdus parva TaxID=2283318 RepID=A0A345PAN7_9GAMM|nr:pyocin activator PrtN family protein [Aquirhabdus parva]AXI04346.1 pyocin activator protein PrtN [Aquirhabdus parva]AXI04390.1 pyocin activator protein PrtN [Aquirhabdus parva]
MSDSYFLLALKFKSPMITLRQALDTWDLGMDETQAKRLANKQGLPYPAIKQGHKAEHMVSIVDLGLAMDAAAEKAKSDWLNMNN